MYRAGFPRHTSRRTSPSALVGAAGRARETITSFQSGEALLSDARTSPRAVHSVCHLPDREGDDRGHLPAASIEPTGGRELALSRNVDRQQPFFISHGIRR